MSRQAAEERYRQRRRAACEAAERLLAEAAGFQDRAVGLREFDGLAVHAAFISGWKNHPTRKVSWPWDRLIWDRPKEPSRFELAVWADERLCGLALGRTSPSRSHCSLHFVEGAPDALHPLKGRVLAAVLTALDQYCLAIGAREMRVVEPFEALLPLYGQHFDFALVKPAGQSPYLRREVRP